MISLEIFFSLCSILLIEACFVINEFQRPPILCRIHKTLLMLIDSLLEIFGKSNIKFHIDFTLQYIRIIHLTLKQFNWVKELLDKRNAPEGKLDKNGKPKKFTRDLESNWTVKNDKPHYGLKEHASVDINHGFVLATTLTPASVNDTNYLSYCTAYSRHTKQPIEKVYADKGYAGKPNRDFLALNDIADGIMRKDSTTAKLTEYEIERNKKISKVRYIACPVA